MEFVRPYRVIADDATLLQQLEVWKAQKIEKIALDFEGEFNLHVYGEHLCLIQVFDGSEYLLIDPLELSEISLKRLLEEPSIEKVMFDCASDAALVRKQYGIYLNHVYDLAIAARVAGYSGNLNALKAALLDKEIVGGKKRGQRENWLKRPLTERQIEYALDDVEDLLHLQELLQQELRQRNLVLEGAKASLEKVLPKGPDRPGYEKLRGFRYLSAEEKYYLKHLFLEREAVAKEFNLPPFRVFKKEALVTLAKKRHLDGHLVRQNIPTNNRRIVDKMIASLQRAIYRAEAGVAKGKHRL